MNRDELLREMGLAPIWRLRRPAGGDTAASVQPVADVSVADSATDAGPSRNTAAVAPAATVAPLLPGIGPERVGSIAVLDWETLVTAVASCRACALCQKRKQAVFGVGDRHPDWLFVGEGPGEQEDEHGEPFVGPAGQLLDAMLAALALKRGEGVYIANAVKCRPPGNRTPGSDEIAACRPFLLRQIALLKPKIIVLLGRAAVHSVLDKEVALAGLRGRQHALGETPVIVTYHPAYLLRSLLEKAKAWEDLCLARSILRRRQDAVQ